MGLDLYHCRVNSEQRGFRFVLDDTPGSELLLAKFARFVVVVEDEQSDWVASFDAAHLEPSYYVPDNYVLEVKKPPEKNIEYQYFNRVPSAPMTTPDRIVFDSSIHPNLRSEDVEAIRHPIAEFLAPEPVPGQNRTTRFAMYKHLVPEQAVYGEQIGYQRKGMLPAFHDEFEAAEFIVDIARVRRMLALCDPKSQLDPDNKYSEGWNFKAEFIENWDEATSFVFVSW